jgi:hypothetical protein
LELLLLSLQPPFPRRTPTTQREKAATNAFPLLVIPVGKHHRSYVQGFGVQPSARNLPGKRWPDRRISASAGAAALDSNASRMEEVASAAAPPSTAELMRRHQQRIRRTIGETTAGRRERLRVRREGNKGGIAALAILMWCGGLTGQAHADADTPGIVPVSVPVPPPVPATAPTATVTRPPLEIPPAPPPALVPRELSGLAVGMGGGAWFAFLGLQARYDLVLRPWLQFSPVASLGLRTYGGWGPALAGGITGALGYNHRLVVDAVLGQTAIDVLTLHGTVVDSHVFYGLFAGGGYEYMSDDGFFQRFTMGIGSSWGADARAAHLPEDLYYSLAVGRRL